MSLAVFMDLLQFFYLINLPLFLCMLCMDFSIAFINVIIIMAILLRLLITSYMALSPPNSILHSLLNSNQVIMYNFYFTFVFPLWLFRNL